MNRGWRDAIAAALALQWGPIGLWAVLAPRSFYDSFPGAGRVWIAVDGPYNEHLTRDVGALFLALAILGGYAFTSRSAPAVRAAGLATTVFSTPHLIYHTATADLLPAVDAVVNAAALTLGLVLGLILAITPDQRRDRSVPAEPPAAKRPGRAAQPSEPTISRM